MAGEARGGRRVSSCLNSMGARYADLGIQYHSVGIQHDVSRRLYDLLAELHFGGVGFVEFFIGGRNPAVESELL